MLIVQKFGGTSLANTQRIKEVAEIIFSEINRGNKVIVVVSAMAGVTNELVNLCNDISDLTSNDQLAEYDSALATGEIVTASLMALALQSKNAKARSVFAWQLPIITDTNHSKALVTSYDTKLLKHCLDNDIIPVISGFQGVTEFNRFSTFGRGGSDTTATLTASAMMANRCDIYTDVEGVFTADPRIVHAAKKLDHISFEEMLEFSSSGAKVLHPRSVEIAMRYDIPIRVLSSFSLGTGTLIKSKDKVMENTIITGITSNKNLLKVTINGSTLKSSKLYNLIRLGNINVEIMVNLNLAKDFFFVVQLHDKNRLEDLLNELMLTKQIEKFSIDAKISIISVIGYGIKNDSTIMQKIIDKLEEESVPIMMLEISEIKVSILIDDDYTEKSVQKLHDLCELNDSILR